MTELSPSQRLIAEASKVTVLTDALGRKLEIRRLTALDQLKLYRAIGSRHSDNQQVYWLTAAAASCAAIDGVDMRFPTSEQHIDDLMRRLGDEGLASIMVHNTAQLAAVQKAAEDAADAEGAAADPLDQSAA